MRIDQLNPEPLNDNRPLHLHRIINRGLEGEPDLIEEGVLYVSADRSENSRLSREETDVWDIGMVVVLRPPRDTEETFFKHTYCRTNPDQEVLEFYVRIYLFCGVRRLCFAYRKYDVEARRYINSYFAYRLP